MSCSFSKRTKISFPNGHLRAEAVVLYSTVNAEEVHIPTQAPHPALTLLEKVQFQRT